MLGAISPQALRSTRLRQAHIAPEQRSDPPILLASLPEYSAAISAGFLAGRGRPYLRCQNRKVECN
jgi:hypothetical protein